MLKSVLIKELDNKRKAAKKNVKKGLFEAYNEGKATAYEEVIFMLKNSTLTDNEGKSTTDEEVIFTLKDNTLTEGKSTAYEEVISMLKNKALTEDSKLSIETYQGGLNDND